MSSQLDGRVQIDFIRLLSAIVRKYGDEGVIEISPADLQGPRGGLVRSIDSETGVLRYEFQNQD